MQKPKFNRSNLRSRHDLELALINAIAALQLPHCKESNKRALEQCKKQLSIVEELINKKHFNNPTT